MGLAEQEEVKSLAAKHGTDRLIIVLGINQPTTLAIMAKTFKNGDPSYAGPLAGIALGIPSYQMLELKEHIPAAVWEQEMAMYELEIDDDAQAGIVASMEEARRE